MIDLPVTNQYKESEKNLFNYLDRHREELISSTGSEILIAIARHYWTFLKMKVYNTSNQILSIPDCVPLAHGIEGDSCIRYGWDRNEHYLECEIFSNGSKEFFYRNRFTKENWGEDYLAKQDISETAIGKLSLFVE